MTSKTFRHVRKCLSLRYSAPIIAALIFVGGPAISTFIAAKTAPSESLSDNAFLSMVPDSTLEKMGRMRRPYGMGEWQFNSFVRACDKANVSPQRVMQTIGKATLSAGFHARDGYAHEDSGDSNEYCAAMDLRTRDLTRSQVRALLSALADAGILGWYRYTGSFATTPHIHAVFVGYPMKRQLRAQVRDFLNDQTGLVGHAREKFYAGTPKQKSAALVLFSKRNALPPSRPQSFAFGVPGLSNDDGGIE